MGKRIFLFLLTNLAIVLTLSLGAEPAQVAASI